MAPHWCPPRTLMVKDSKVRVPQLGMAGSVQEDVLQLDVPNASRQPCASPTGCATGAQQPGEDHKIGSRGHPPSSLGLSKQQCACS